MIPEGFITSLLDRADIVDVINRYVPLKKAGRNWMCCCPFHKEKSPSFSVSETKQFFKCFGCGESGNAIGFIMKYEGLEFPEAVRKLASLYGMTVPEDRSPARAAAREKARTLTDYMDEAAGFYTRQLKLNQRAIEYLKARQLTGATAAKFGLGYSPDEWHALQGLFKEKYEAKELVDCGLVNVKNDRRYDAFRGRIMFPIRNGKGQTIGFGARTMNGDEQPKYLNSPETPIYHKGSELYGFFEGREAIHAKGRAIVCEGYMDVIQLSQAGFEESVAALGTSITPEHVRKLFKIADRVYFSFDGDTAGRKAARRALEAALPVITDMQKAGFIILPPEHDPDSLIKEQGAQAYEREIEKAYTLTEYLKRILLEGKELMYAEDRAKIVAEARPLVLSMQHAPVLRLTLIRELAGIARLQPEDIERQYGLAPAVPAQPAPRPSFGGGFGAQGGAGRPYGGARYDRYARGGYAPARPEPRVRVKDIRERILQCFLSYPALIGEFSAQVEEELLTSEHPVARAIVEVWRAAGEEEEQGAPLTAAALLMRLSDSPEAARYERLLSEELQTCTPEAGARLELRRAFIELELERTKARIERFALEGNRDRALFEGLTKRRTFLMKAVESVRAEEKEYRLREENLSRREVNGRAAEPTPLSANPIVARLQQHFLSGGAAAAAAGAEPVPAPAREPAPDRVALREAIAAGASKRLAASVPQEPASVRLPAADGAVPFAAPAETDAADEALRSLQGSPVPEEPDGFAEIPPEDDVPYAFEEIEDGDAGNGYY